MDLYYTDPAHRLITAGDVLDLDDLSGPSHLDHDPSDRNHDLSDLDHYPSDLNYDLSGLDHDLSDLSDLDHDLSDLDHDLSDLPDLDNIYLI